MLRGREYLLINFSQVATWVAMLILVSTPFSFAGEIIDDFEDGDTEGWERTMREVRNQKPRLPALLDELRLAGL